MARKTSTAPGISERALNRATLARQGLMQRQAISAKAMLGHLIGMQGQVQNAPYFSLWARLTGFRPAELEALLDSHEVVRATMMRVTLHVGLAEDFLGIRPHIDPVAARVFKTNHLAPLAGIDLDELRAEGRRLLDVAALSPAELGRRLQEKWPDVAPIDLSMAVRFLDPVVHVPPAGHFGATGAPKVISAKRWLGREPEAVALETLVLRYLSAFGPATGQDFNTWSGLKGGPALMEKVRDQLVVFSGADGRELFDLPDAPRPDAGVEAPVRLLGDYDNVLLGYANRERVVSAEAFKGLWRANGLRPAVLVDGVVAGTWKFSVEKNAVRVAIYWFDRLSPAVRALLDAEAQALAAAMVPGKPAEISFAAFAG